MNRIVKKFFIILFAVAAAACLAVGAACTDNGEKNESNAVYVTLVSEDGTAEAPRLMLPGDALPVVTADNMDFEGYWTDAELTQRYTGTVVPETDITLYYKLVPQAYNVILDYGPLGIVEYGSVNLGESIVLPAREINGKEFAGFSEERGAEAVYPAGTPVSDLAQKGRTITLYAVWISETDGDFVIEDGVVTAYTGSDVSVTFPMTASVIAEGVFENSSARRNITSVTVPDCYTTIERGAFEGLNNLESLTVPFIGGSRYSDRFLAYVFGAKRYTDNVYSFALYSDEEGNTIVPGEEDMSSLYIPQTLRTVRVTDKITDIAEGAFYYAYGLENLVIDHPENLRRVGDSAFEACYYFGMDGELGTAVCPVWLENVSYIGDSAFKSYTGDTDCDVKYISYNGTTLSLLDYEAPLNNLAYIPELKNVVEIGDDAFYYCAMITDLEFGDKLQTIGAQAFMFTITLTHVIFPDSLQSIGEFAFNASGITSIEFEGDVRSIGTMAFAQCSSLSEVIFNGDSVPVLEGGQCFNNNVEEAVTESWNLVLNEGFAVSIKDVLLQEYMAAADWSEYTDYLNPVKTDGSTVNVAYMSLGGDGWDVMFDFAEGGTVYVTDPTFAFISMLDSQVGQYSQSVSMTYPLRYEILSQEEYFAVLANSGYDQRPVYANQYVVRLWHPMVIDQEGGIISSYMVVTELPYGSSEGRVLLPVADAGEQRGVYGSAEEGTYIISVNLFNVPQVYKVTGGERVAEAEPQGTYFAAVTGNSTATGITIIYYDKDFNEISRREFVRDDASGTNGEAPIYELSENQITLLTGGMYNDAQIFVKGGTADIFIGGKQYSAQVGAVSGAAYGEEGYRLSFSSVTLDGKAVDGLAGSAVFSDFDGDNYARIDLTVGEERTMILNTVNYADWEPTFYNALASDPEVIMPSYSQLGDEWRYAKLSDPELLGSINIYTYNGISYFKQFDGKGALSAFGTADVGENGVTLAPEGGNEMSCTFDDDGSLVLDGVVYSYYDYLTDMTTAYTETQYIMGMIPVTVWYYTVKTDGYGNMVLIIENYSEDTDDPVYYLGTYENGRPLDSQGLSYGMLMFTGMQVDSYGEPLYGAYEETTWIVYDCDTRSYVGDDVSPWTSDLVGLDAPSEDVVIEVVDELGYKVFDVTVDIYGLSSHTEYTYTLDEKGNASYTAVESDIVYFVSDPNNNGNYIAVGSDGLARYIITPVQDGDGSSEGPLRYRLTYTSGIMVNYGDTAITPDASALESLPEGGINFGTL